VLIALPLLAGYAKRSLFKVCLTARIESIPAKLGHEKLARENLPAKI